MTNEEIVEEILRKAENLKIKEEVLELSRKLREAGPKMSLLESIELAFNHLKEC